MPGENIQDWSTTAASNGTADSSINWAEGQARATVNNSARSMMAAHAKDRDLQNGSIVTTGTANAQAFSSGVGYTSSVPTGLRVLLKIGPGLTNTASVTMNMDGIGTVTIKSQTGSDIGAGALVAGSYCEFRYDGTNWILLRGGVAVVVQVFTASGTYTPTTGMTHCIIECVGGGGGGGACTGQSAYWVGGGGGGSGSYSRKYATAAVIGASQTVTIGAAGIGGGGGPATGSGTGGGITNLGLLCDATGGGGGGLSYVNNGSAAGGAGGNTGTGDVVAAGNPGGNGTYLGGALDMICFGGNGGASYFGGAGRGASNYNSPFNGVGTPGSATNYGSGGGGTAVATGPYGSNGGNGSNGVTIITEFIA